MSNASIPSRRSLLGGLTATWFIVNSAPSFAQLLGPSVDLSTILARNELRVALPTFDSAPFFYARDGRLEGSDIDMARDIGREIGVEVIFTRSATTFDGVVDVIAGGGADVAICKLSRTLHRERVIRFTQPYLVLKHALALHRVRFAELARDREPEGVLRSFVGSIGVIQGSSFSDFARVNFPRAEIVEMPSWNAVLAAVRSGQIIGAYRDEFEIKKILLDDPAALLTLRTVTLSDLTDTLGMAVPTGFGHLHAFLDMFITERVRNTSVAVVLARYQKLTREENRVD